ncbi:MAG: DEAD/DEAH box helicase [Clostridia bacterium]|nr:DEAD/DEAH box helicase [Clostridia bacterium]
MDRQNDIFKRFSPFIRDFIYSRGWNELRDVQCEAAEIIFDTDYDLLISSSTASGKTEAAFFPIISELYGELSDSVGVLYIAPLKSLINDQFLRLDELLDYAGIPVFHWHGDVAQSHKTKFLNDPRGILQITPESLESMLINRSNDIFRLFNSLKYVIIDEIHVLTGTDRGNQIMCQLARIEHIIGRPTRRIGLSATIGSCELAAKWLDGGRGRQVHVTKTDPGKVRWRLGLEHFYIQNDSFDQSKPQIDGSETKAMLDPAYEYMYDCVRDKKSLVFSNSREETEYVTATLRQIAEKRGDDDIFLIHHGNLSAALREEAEMKMKNDDIHAVTCATVTLELGIDIGRLERIIQKESPHSVTSFLQRLGRSGRRGEPSEMMMVFSEENPLPNAPLPELMPWELLRAIAIIQLYIEERFIEPPRIKHQPYSLCFQQTLSVLAASGELTAKSLAERVLSLPSFAEITKEDYKTLILSMLNNDYIELTEQGGIIIGLRGEKLINSFKFYAVFKDSEDFTVRCGSDEIGTVTSALPVGDRFALAGRVWEVEELDIPRRLIYVKQVKGKMEISWPGDYGEIHTRILERMREVLAEDTEYPYLKPNAAARLKSARAVARNTGMLTHGVVRLGGYSYCIFPWLGTRSFRTLRKLIAANAARFGISKIEFDGCNYITLKMEKANGKELLSGLCDILEYERPEPISLIGKTDSPAFDKYDPFIPSELLRKAYAADKLDLTELYTRLPELLALEKEDKI